MSIETFQIASAVFGATTISFAHLSFGLRKHLKSAQAHVANLQAFSADQCRNLDDLMVKNAELNSIVTKVHDQRISALNKARAKAAARAAAVKADEVKATEKTLGELKLHPLRPRDQVLSDIRSSKAAQHLSSAG